MSGQILTVDPNLPIPPGTTSSDPNNPKSAIKSLMLAGAQANEDAKYDPIPKREGFRSQTSTYNSMLYLILIAIILYFICKKCVTYGIILFTIALLLVYIERNLNRTV